MKGQPRGYAFVTYKTLDSAKESLAKLQGKRIGQKMLSVKWACAATKEEYYGKKKPLMNIPALSGAKQDKKLSKVRAIQAIEAKLKTMECLLPAQSPLSSSSSSSSSRHSIDNTMNTSRKEIRNSNSVHPIHHKGTASNSRCKKMNKLYL
ncbi:hypothetical protein RUM43_008421 [Polyplax serrata]|uniref:RRM domain-containing protein n=1 Tax=Polyplax serrata TaxID=468196 RepID=A0AAN8RTS0_POLSC